MGEPRGLCDREMDRDDWARQAVERLCRPDTDAWASVIDGWVAVRHGPSGNGPTIDMPLDEFSRLLHEALHPFDDDDFDDEPGGFIADNSLARLVMGDDGVSARDKFRDGWDRTFKKP